MEDTIRPPKLKGKKRWLTIALMAAVAVMDVGAQLDVLPHEAGQLLLTLLRAVGAA